MATFTSWLRGFAILGWGMGATGGWACHRWLFVAAAVSMGGAACQKERQLEHLGQVPSFSFVDQEGRPFGSANLQRKVTVAAFMFTRCPTICPRITATMQELQTRAKQQNVPIHWVSFSVDPENDTAAVLAQYAAERRLDLTTWSFVTGDTAQIREVAEQGFKIAAEGKAEATAEHFGISHGSHLVLVDQQGQIRGYYRSLDGDAQARLLDDAKWLAAQ
jgi:protein SCO1/2